jgi:bifunctional non-homologous end joining protein LigD
MTGLVPELASLPDGLVLDGELVAWGDDGLPSFPRLCERMLHRQPGISVTYVIFDVLEVEDVSTMLQPYQERRRVLEALELSKPAIRCDSFERRRGALRDRLRPRHGGHRREATQ